MAHLSDGDHRVTDALLRWNEDGKLALDEVLPLVAQELRRMAQAFLAGEPPDHTLVPTALVHELYLRLLDRREVDWVDRSHFFGFAARTMRRILVDHGRARRAEKRGGSLLRVPLDEASGLSVSDTADVVDLDDALARLESLDERLARVVELRFFAGLSIEQTAEVLGVGTATVGRDWATARAFLYQQLTSRLGPASPTDGAPGDGEG